MFKNFFTACRDLKVYLSRTWQLSLPYWKSEERWLARGLVVGILLMLALQLLMASKLSYATAAVFDNLDKRDVSTIGKNLGIWAGLLTVMIASYIAALHLKKVLIINWRRFLTEKYLSTYLDNGLFNQLELKDYDLDNPDQRISADLHNFAEKTLDLFDSLFTNVGGFFVFSAILWKVSGSLPLAIGDFSIVIPGYMFWVALLYAVLLTWITHKVAHPLVRLNFERHRVEADFRYRLVRIRENTESIALSKGEAREQAGLSTGFDHIRTNWLDLLKYQKRLLGLGYGASQLGGFFPYLAAMPALIAGSIGMGGFLQLRGAFGAVQGTLSWFANSYEILAIWKSSVDRILTLDDAIESAKSDRRESKLTLRPSSEGDLRIGGLTISLPTDEPLVSIKEAILEPGKNIIITGRSGSGKSTLFRTLSGQWVWADGTITQPSGKLTFLPQKPYFPIATLKEALAYPEDPDSFDEDVIISILHKCLMSDFVDRLHEHADWARTLSGGEQQRIAIARAILSNPDWLFIDEATSAMDTETEATIYNALNSELPNTTIVSIAHRPSLKKYHDILMHLDPQDKTVSITELNTASGDEPVPA